MIATNAEGEVVDEFTGETAADNGRHMIGRIVLLTLLMELYGDRLPQLRARTDGDDPLRGAVAFVRCDLGLDMPWLALELAQLIHGGYPWQDERRTIASWFGERVRRGNALAPPLPPAPSYVGLTVTEARQRKREYDAAFEAALAEPHFPTGRWVDRTMRQVDCFYRARLKLPVETVTSIAAKRGNGDHRSSVRRDIDEAARFLGLSSLAWRDLEQSD